VSVSNITLTQKYSWAQEKTARSIVTYYAYTGRQTFLFFLSGKIKGGLHRSDVAASSYDNQNTLLLGEKS